MTVYQAKREGPLPALWRDAMTTETEHPDVLVVDFYCQQCGHRPGAWWVDGAKVPLPVPEEAEFVRKVSESAVHDGCGGRIVIATEPLRRDAVRPEEGQR